MVNYDYQLAKATLNENDKDRIVCIYLSSDPAAVDWAKATKDYGSASVESFKKTTANMLKKLDAAGAKVSDDGSTPAAPATPASAKSAAGKKRKSKGEISVGGDAEEDTIATPKAKRGRPRKATTPKPAAEDTSEPAEEEVVKKENADDLV